MHPVGFEPTRLSSSELKSDALDHSATDAFTSFFFSFLIFSYYFYFILFFILYFYYIIILLLYYYYIFLFIYFKKLLI